MIVYSGFLMFQFKNKALNNFNLYGNWYDLKETNCYSIISKIHLLYIYANIDQYIWYCH